MDDSILPKLKFALDKEIMTGYFSTLLDKRTIYKSLNLGQIKHFFNNLKTPTGRVYDRAWFDFGDWLFF